LIEELERRLRGWPFETPEAAETRITQQVARARAHMRI